MMVGTVKKKIRNVRVRINSPMANYIIFGFSAGFLSAFAGIALQIVYKGSTGIYFFSPYLIGSIVAIGTWKFGKMSLDKESEQDEDIQGEELEIYFKSIFENANEGVLLVNPSDKKIYSANVMFCSMLGFTEEEIENLDIIKIFPKENMPYISNEFERILTGEVKIIPNISMHKKDGGTVHYDIHGVLINFFGRVYVIIMFRNVNERENTDLQRSLSEEKYRLFLQHFQGIIFCSKLDSTPLFIHGAVKKITGYSEEDFYVGIPKWEQIIYQDDRAMIEESLHKLEAVPGYCIGREYRIINEEGQIKWVHEIIQNICDDTNEPIMIQGTLYDTTFQMHAEEELMDASEKLTKGTLKPESLANRQDQITLPHRSTVNISRDKKDYTILVVEDNFVNQALAQTILQEEGYNVIPTSDGREAVAAYKSGDHVDLLLIDIQMSVLAGLEAIRVIRDIESRERRSEKVPIIALIDPAMNEYKGKCINAGCSDWLLKPIDKSTLQKKMNAYIMNSYRGK